MTGLDWDTNDLTSPRIQVLLIEDDEDDYLITRMHLHKIKNAIYDIDWVHSCDTAYEQLSRKNYDVMLVDHQLGSRTGIELIRDLRNAKVNVPFIMLTGVNTMETDLDAMEAGASDYLIKGQLAPEVLERSIRYAMQHHQTLKALAQSERTKELFYAALAHDLKTPIFGETKVLEHLKKERFGPLTDEQHNVVKELIQSNNYLYQMVTNLLTSYKYQHNQIQLKKTLVNYNQLVEELLGEQLLPLAKGKQQAISLQLDDHLPLVAIDIVEIKRVIYNLVHNALNHNSDRGPVTIRTMLDASNNTILTQVEDFGLGIQPEQIPRLFQPYSTVKTLRPVGTGLGLFLSRQIIDAHGGNIGVTSTPGIGSCFYFSVPYVPLQAPLVSEQDSKLAHPST